MAATADVVVVGAGITGASTAYHLAAAGAGEVRLLEADVPASGGTGKSAAIVRQHYSSPLAARLTRDAIAMLTRLPEEHGGPPVFVPSGWHMLVPEPLMEAARRIVGMQARLGIESSLVPAADLASELPWLNPDGVAGICHEPAGGYADPVRATEAYVSAFERAGGRLATRTPARKLLGTPERVTGVLTDDGPLHAGAVVNAAGPWARPLAASVGLELPLRAVREQDTVWEARGGRPLPATSVSDAVDAIYLRPLGGRRFVLGRGFPKAYEDVNAYNYKQTVDEAFVSEVLERAVLRFPPLAGATRVDAYTALYDVTPDWMPFIGPRSGVEGYYDACGGSGHGFKIGPAIGRELARWITEGVVAADFRALSHDRITSGALFVGAYGGNRA